MGVANMVVSVSGCALARCALKWRGGFMVFGGVWWGLVGIDRFINIFVY